MFLDITASSDGRETIVGLAKKVAEQVFIPFTIGGGIRSVDDARAVLRAGADKVSVNSAAVKEPELVSVGGCIWDAMRGCDRRKTNGRDGWNVYETVDVKIRAWTQSSGPTE